MYVVGVVIALAALVGMALLVRFIGTGEPRVALWAALLVMATMIAAVLAQMASIYYKTPIGWIVAVAASLMVWVVLFWIVGAAVGWKVSHVVALVALVLLSFVALTVLMIAVPSGTLLTPLFEARAEQIANANDFDVLLPVDAQMNTDAGMPVDDTDDGTGVSVSYGGFVLTERKAASPLGRSDLKKLVSAGAKPVGDIGPGSAIPQDAEYTELEVDGSPALGVSYRAATEEKMDDLLGTDPINVLVFERDGVEVVLYSQGYLEYQSDGSSVPRPPLSLDELTVVGESLEPVD